MLSKKAWAKQIQLYESNLSWVP